MQVEMQLSVNKDGKGTLRTPLPDEVQFESLATRVRPFTLNNDRLFWPNAGKMWARGGDPVDR
ncbi:MAG: hypothetical protein QOE41_2318 [Mycobacterium sp.]|jgi:hypothetical protein|nr:hypothetical protein [Mycobacterium sp.]MDT5133007.1 hypothetical protein [Mycobacterium sp.]